MTTATRTPTSPDVQWDAWYTEKMVIDHLLLLEDHLLDYGERSADDQCLGCMVWHCEKLKAYCHYEAPKFFQDAHADTYRDVCRFAEELQGILVNSGQSGAAGLDQGAAVTKAKRGRELRYELIGYDLYDFAVAGMEAETSPLMRKVYETCTGAHNPQWMACQRNLDQFIIRECQLEALAQAESTEPTWCINVRRSDDEIRRIVGALGNQRSRLTALRRELEVPLNICRGQAEMFQELPRIDPYGSRCRDPKTGLWVSSDECGYAPETGVSNITFAMGANGLTRYEFRFKVIGVEKLAVSHDPHTFEPNPDYPPDLQPRLRGRAATRIQVEKIAQHLDPDALITDFHVLDRGAPIVGPDNVVESGNGRVMGIMRAVTDHPDVYDNYRATMLDRIGGLGLRPETLYKVNAPILVRERISDVDRVAFSQEANTSVSIAPSAIEQARTDAPRITLEMLESLQVGENQGLADALRQSRNQPIVARFLAKLPEQEQARLVDAKGLLNQDGVQRMTMAVFVSVFIGDAGLRLAEMAFETIHLEVRNVISGIEQALGPLARAENLIKEGHRRTELSIGDDLAKAANTYASIKRTPELTVTKYIDQGQMLERELTPFQESLLQFMDAHARSAKYMGEAIRNYANLVIETPAPAQVTLIPEAEPSKEELWQAAIRKTEKGREPVPALFQARSGSKSSLAAIVAELGQADDLCEMADPAYRELVPFFRAGDQEEAALAQESSEPRRKIDEILARLQAGVEAIHQSDNFQAFTRTMAKFHQYSLGNIMLITVQRPDATRVAGFHKWKELSRSVRKGEKGIAILAPCFPPRVKPPEPPDEEEAEELVPRPLYFKAVHVFDVSQTEGKELPTVEVPVLTGEESAPLFRRAETFAAGRDIRVSRDSHPELPSGTMGYWDESQRVIWVRPGVPQMQATKTLLHEIGHALCEHDPSVPRGDAETIAEGVAFAVGAHFGFDTGVRSFPYVAVWSRDIKVLRGNLAAIHRVAKSMMDGISVIPEPEPAAALLLEKAPMATTQQERCIREMAQWFVENRRPMARGERRPILSKYYPTEAEALRFLDYFASPEGTSLFVKWLRYEEWRQGVAGPPRGDLAQEEHPYARHTPKDIQVFATTIEKHYVEKEQFHSTSFRVVKPLPDILVFLGCLKGDRWDPGQVRCFPNATVHKTIVPRTPENMEEVEEWRAIGVPIEYLKGKGTEPRGDGLEGEGVLVAADGSELLEVIRAIQEAKALKEAVS